MSLEALHALWYYRVVEPWVHGDWMWRAVGISMLVAVACAVLGCWLYVRRLSMMSDALSHIVVPGIAVGFIVSGGRESLAMLLGAVFAGVTASFLISAVQRRTRVKEDAAIGVVYTALFAAGVILVNKVARNVHLDPDCVLFGNVLGVRDESFVLVALACAAVIVVTLVLFRPLLVSSFDPGLAAALGLPVLALHHGLMALLSVTAVASFEAVGAVLVVALLIAPAATAHLVCDRMAPMLAVAVAHAVLSALAGMYVAIWFDTNPAGSIVLVGAALYVVALVGAPGRGLIARGLMLRARRRRLRRAALARPAA